MFESERTRIAQVTKKKHSVNVQQYNRLLYGTVKLASTHSKAYTVPGTLCGKREVIHQMAHHGQTYRVYNQSSVVVKWSSIQSVITLPERTTLASRARKATRGYPNARKHRLQEKYRAI